MQLYPIRINRYIAMSTGLSRRSSDLLIKEGHVKINDVLAKPGDIIKDAESKVEVNNKLIEPLKEYISIKLNKPTGYVVSREGQGNKTVYDLLPKEFSGLKAVGRLDKDSSGLILLTNDGQLAQQLTHPSYNKQKVYIVKLNKALSDKSKEQLTKGGVQLNDGISQFNLSRMDNSGKQLKVIMQEGRNRQIRRTFKALGYQVISLQRISFGDFKLANLKPGEYELL